MVSRNVPKLIRNLGKATPAGRPVEITPEIEQPVLRTARENRWVGYGRIAREMRKLGFSRFECTSVRRILNQHGSDCVRSRAYRGAHH